MKVIVIIIEFTYIMCTPGGDSSLTQFMYQNVCKSFQHNTLRKYNEAVRISRFLYTHFPTHGKNKNKIMLISF